MIPTDPETIKKMEELANRNIANGDWGDEVTLPGETMPRSPEERTIAQVLSEKGGRRLRKRKS